MSLHEFYVEKTHTSFLYDNYFSSMKTPDGKKLSKGHELPQGYIDAIDARNKDSNKEIKKSNAPAMIKIVMGHRCNYSCGYCMQDELSQKADLSTLSSRDYASELVKKINKNLILDDLQRIELWGGETLLYWNDVKAIMEEFDRDGLTFYIPTNGTTIQHKHLDFFQDLKATVCMGISHDGPAHPITRGPDFLERKVDVLKRMQDLHPKVQFSFNPVISSENWDLFACNDFFVRFLRKHNLKNVPLMYEIIQVYELDEVRGTSRSYALSGEKLEMYKENIKDYLRMHAKQYKTMGARESAHGDLLLTNLFELYAGSLTFARELGKEDILHSGAKCQADQERQLSIDMAGNVRTCQNVGEEAIYGNISEIESAGVKNIDTNQGPHCKECRVRFLCVGQCPIKQDERVFETNCKINKVHYGAIQDVAFEFLFDSKVSYVGKFNEEELRV